MSIIMSTSNIIQKRVHEQKVAESLKIAEAGLVGYYYRHQKLPIPEGKVIQENGVFIGEFPTSKLGNIPVKIEYYVDARTTQDNQGSLYALEGNRMHLAPSEFVVPYALKHKNHIVYMTGVAFIAKYFSYMMTEKPNYQNPKDAPAFQP